MSLLFKSDYESFPANLTLLTVWFFEGLCLLKIGDSNLLFFLGLLCKASESKALVLLL